MALARRINRAIELLAQDQPIYYMGGHIGHILTFAQGVEDAGTWADYINVGMEHGAFDMAGLDAYIQGLIAGGPTRSGHRTPAVIVEAPVEGASAEIVRSNAWQFRQILARGVHGVLLCQVESADAVRAFVEACRYPINRIGVSAGLSEGSRGVGSEPSAASVWGADRDEYVRRADPWPSATTCASTAIVSLPRRRHAARIVWAGSMASSFICWSTIRRVAGNPPHPWQHR